MRGRRAAGWRPWTATACSRSTARRQLVDRLGLLGRLAAHAAARDVLARDPDGDRLVEAAAHARAAWSRSAADAERAVALARAAGAQLRSRDDLAGAERVLRAAGDIARRALPDRSRAGLAVELAGTVLAAGRLGDARALFRRAVEAAEAEGDPRALAEAALGLGGIWLNEHPGSEAAALVRGVMDRAAVALDISAAAGAEDHALRARLCLRREAERAYREGGGLEGVAAALDEVRSVGDADALAEGLSLVHHLLLGPHLQAEREAVTAELLRVLGAGVTPLRRLVALCWRAVDHALVGSSSAARSRSELAARAAEVGCEGVLFVAEALAVTDTLRAGRFEEAERAAHVCYERGVRAGDPDAPAILVGQVAAVRLYQGREAELVPLVAEAALSPAVADGERSLAAAAALCGLRAGDPAPARALLARVGDGDLPVTSSSWLASLATYAELAHVLGHAGAAEVVAAELAPFAGLPVMASLGVACYGPVDRSLALAAATAGDLVGAAAHARRSVEVAKRLGNRPAAVLCEAALAQVVTAGDGIARGGGALVAEALVRLDRALAGVRELGMDGWLPRWEPLAAALRRSSTAHGPPAAPLPAGSTAADPLVPLALRMERLSGGVWRVQLGGRTAGLADMTGLAYLAQLVAAAGTDVPVLVLRGGGEQATSHQPLLDRQALASLRARSAELRAELDACARSAAGRRARLEDELDEILAELRRGLGLGGRSRSFADETERARTGVRKAVTRAVAALERVDPVIASHVRASVRTGRTCRYDAS